MIVVAESGVRLLAAQKPIKRQNWWKGKFTLFCSPAKGWGADSRPKADNSPLIIRGQELLKGSFRGAQVEEGLHAETAPLALTVILKLVISGLTSIILIVFSTVSLQFQGRFVPVSLRPVLRIVAAYVMVTVWSFHS